MLKNLQKLGFTPNETKIYSTLLNLGQSSTGPIIEKTGLHRNIVYDVLDILVKKKLVSETIKANKKQFVIANPEILIHNVQQQAKIALRAVCQIKKGLKTVAPQITVYEDKSGWQSAYRYLAKRMKPDDYIYSLGAGADKWVKAMGDYFVTWEIFLKKKKINNKMVAYAWQRQEIEDHQSNPMRITKYLSSEHSIPANTEIFKDGIFIQIYSDPIMLIEIRSREVAKSYLQHFDVLWKMGVC